MATHRTYLVAIQAPDEFDGWDDEEDGRTEDYADDERLMFEMNLHLAIANIQITDLQTYA